MNCPKCGSPMAHEIDSCERVEYFDCWTCGKRVYIKEPKGANGFCQCGRKFVRRGRATLCEVCRAIPRVKKPLPPQGCKVCGRQYTPKKRGRKFCSDKCRKLNSRDLKRARSKQYYEKNKETILARQRELYKNDEDRKLQHRKWQEENREKCRAYTRKHYSENRKRLNAERMARYYRIKEEAASA